MEDAKVIPSSLSQAKSDPRLRGAPLAVYVWCLEYLDAQQDRAVKVFELCVALRMKKRTAGEALDVLVRERWIERTKRHGHGEAARYRLLPAPMRPSVKARAA